MEQITPVILCGGAGTRLWPVSRRSYPKQFSPLAGDLSLFQQTALRLRGGLANMAAPIIATAPDFRFIVAEQLMSAGVEASEIIIEPSARNTAPPVLAAALIQARRDPDGLLLITPSDHVVRDVTAFHDSLLAAVPSAREGRLVTFGIVPDRPETGFGYLELSAPMNGIEAVPLSRFVEKPDRETAAKLVSSGRYLWNAGMFLARADRLIAAYRDHAPQMFDLVCQSVKDARSDLDFVRLHSEPWEQIHPDSIDYAVMEHDSGLSVVPLDAGWSDLGSWDAVQSLGPADQNGTVCSGAVVNLDCKSSLLRSENADQYLVGLGLHDVIAVATRDAVLVADRSRAQEVKKAVAALETIGAPQATGSPRDHRPWGHFETLVRDARFQVKRIHVKPGASLSLQSHQHRSEHWVVVSGVACVTIGDRVELLGENQSIYVPLREKHRLENPGQLPLILIEVQVGSYLGEDDITRYDDVYARDS